MANPDSNRRLNFTRTRSWIVFVLGFLVFLPGILSPYWLDDYVHKSMVRGTFPSHRSPFDLYNFVTDGDRALLIDRGVLPWWTHPHLTIRFFRPLSSFLRWLDLTISDVPLVQHVHSLAWWALAVVAARALYKQWMSARGAWIATFIFALAPCHAIPLSWLANREVLVSLAFGTFGLGACAKFLREGLRRDAVVAFVLFSIAMLAGEYTLAIGGYVIALAWFVRASRARRLAGLATFAIPAIVTMIARVVLGFGNAGSGFYRDPFGQTGAFFSGAPRRIARLWVDAWLASDSDWVMDVRPWILGAFVFVVLILISIPIRRALAATDDDARRVGRALIVGSLLALVPMVSVLPSPRLLGVAMIGVAFAIAIALEHTWFPNGDASLGKNDFASLVVLLLAFMHLVPGPVVSFWRARFSHETATDFQNRTAWLRDRTGDDPEDAKIVVARAGWQTVLFSPFALRDDGALPKRWWVLSLVPHALMLRRGERSIDLIVPKGRGYFPTGPDDLFRSTDLPLHAGDEVRVPGLHAKVIEGGESGPGRVHFDFDQKLESLVWIADAKDGWKDVPPPQLGFGIASRSLEMNREIRAADRRRDLGVRVARRHEQDDARDDERAADGCSRVRDVVERVDGRHVARRTRMRDRATIMKRLPLRERHASGNRGRGERRETDAAEDPSPHRRRG